MGHSLICKAGYRLHDRKRPSFEEFRQSGKAWYFKMAEQRLIFKGDPSGMRFFESRGLTKYNAKVLDILGLRRTEVNPT